MADGFRLTWRGAAAVEASGRGVLRGLAAAGEHLVGEARREVPLREGTLSRSLRAEIDAAARGVTVSADTPYARVQHERTDFDHPGGRKAKYVEDPFAREQQTCLALVAAAVRRELR